MKRQEEIKLLVSAGHSADKALEIALDAERSDPHAIKWIELMRREAEAA